MPQSHGLSIERNTSWTESHMGRSAQRLTIDNLPPLRWGEVLPLTKLLYHAVREDERRRTSAAGSFSSSTMPTRKPETKAKEIAECHHIVERIRRISTAPLVSAKNHCIHCLRSLKGIRYASQLAVDKIDYLINSSEYTSTSAPWCVPVAFHLDRNARQSQPALLRHARKAS